MYEKYACVWIYVWVGGYVHVYMYSYSYKYSPVTLYTLQRIFHNSVCQQIMFTHLFYFVLSFLNEHWTTHSAQKNFYFCN